MQDFFSGRLLQEYWRRGIFGVGLVIIFFVLLFVYFTRSSSRRIDTSPITKLQTGESAKSVYATGDELPQCISLTASPLKGGARLSVTFIAEGSAINGVIKNFEFTFGDGKIEIGMGVESKGISMATISHVYEKPGKYTALVRIQDALGNWSNFTDSCKQTITVEGEILGK